MLAKLFNQAGLWYYLLRWFVIVSIGLIIYGQTFFYGFVFDDHQFIVNNPLIRNLDLFQGFWQGGFPKTRFIGLYSFALNYQFHQLNPAGYHVVNFLIHLLAVGCVWAVAGIIFKIVRFNSVKQSNRVYLEAPFLIALLFLVHPANTQAVTYITQRFESLATVCYLGCVYFYLSARISTQRMHQILSIFGVLLSACIGFLSKEVIASLPLMILMFETILFKWKKEDVKKQYWIYIGIGVITVVLFIIFQKLVNAGMNVFVTRLVSESHDGDVITLGNYLLTQMRVFLTFLRLLFFPVNQNLDYDYPLSQSFLNPPLTGVGLVVFMTMALSAWKMKNKHPWLSIGIFWLMITFSMNLIPRTNVIFEHKLYLMMFGFVFVVGAGLTFLTNHRLVFLIVAGIVSLWAVMTYTRNLVWKNEMALWQDVANKSPHKSRVFANLGRMYGVQGDYTKAIETLSHAIALNPSDDISLQNRAIIQGILGQSTAALEDFKRAIELAPNYPVTYVKRAYLYIQLKQYDLAFDDLRKAISLQPSYEEAYIQRAQLWLAMGDREKAIADFKTALRINPNNEEVKKILHFQTSLIY